MDYKETWDKIDWNSDETQVAEQINKFISDGAEINSQRKWDKQTVLMCAIRNRHEKAAHILISSGADINMKDCSGMTPLIFSAQNGIAELTEPLVKAGANIHDTNNNDENALEWAVISGKNVKTITELLRLGADINRKSKYATGNLAHTATWYNHREILRTLFSAGIDMNARNNKGAPLNYCCPKGTYGNR